jgi:single-stranded-DNA-specific exonuclease
VPLAPRLSIAPCDVVAAHALERELGVAPVVAQVLVRRGLGDVERARCWLAAADEHPPDAMAGMAAAVEVVLAHVRAGRRITVHGDYDVDGVSSTAILVRALRELGADVDWFLPSRTEDGYGLSARTVRRLAARGTALLLTADCGITAVAEVAVARAAGLDVVVSDHHSPRADGELPDAPIVHPALGGYPCPDLCAAGVAHKLAAALLATAGRDPCEADADLDVVALATVADCVPLRGENRRLVRAGVGALARTTRPGLRALMRVARVDPGRVDATAIGFRLAPRINAAGRLHRADAGLELLLTTDPGRADAIAEELDRANADRRHVETRILFEAEAQVAAAGERPAYVLAGEDWHPGVIGIVASRVAERHHRPCVLVALDGERGTGSGRSIPAFDLLGGLDAAAAHLVRHGGHRAAAGCEVERGELAAFREAFEAHAAAVLRPEDLVPEERVDAVVAGDELGLDLAEELEALAPFGTANPGVCLLVPAARLGDPRPLGEGKHVRFTVESGGRRAGAVAFGRAKVPCDGPVDATFTLERNEWRGAVEPRLVLRHAMPCAPEPIVVVGEREDPVGAGLAGAVASAGEREDPVGAALAAAVAPAPLTARGAWPPPAGVAFLPRHALGPLPRAAPAAVRDRRSGGIAGTLAALVHAGEPVLAVAADARARARHLGPILGGFRLCSHAALAADPELAEGARHVVAIDPPADPAHAAALLALAADPAADAARPVHRADPTADAGRSDHDAGPSADAGRLVHLAWGEPEVAFALAVHERDHDLRPPAVALFRSLRELGRAEGEALRAALARLDGRLAVRALRVLVELQLVHADPESRTVVVAATAERTALDRSATYRRHQGILEDGRRWLSGPTARAA